MTGSEPFFLWYSKLLLFFSLFHHVRWLDDIGERLTVKAVSTRPQFGAIYLVIARDDAILTSGWVGQSLCSNPDTCGSVPKSLVDDFSYRSPHAHFPFKALSKLRGTKVMSKILEMRLRLTERALTMSIADRIVYLLLLEMNDTPTESLYWSDMSSSPPSKDKQRNAHIHFPFNLVLRQNSTCFPSSNSSPTQSDELRNVCLQGL